MREKAWRKSEIARSACATMRVSRKISIYRAQRSQQGCSLSLGMLRLAEPPTGRARLRSSLKSPRNPITPIETSRVATLHPGLYKGLREGGRRVIGRDVRELLPPPAGGPPPSKREVWGFRRSRPPALPSIAYRGFAVAPMTLRAPSRNVVVITIQISGCGE